MRRAAYIPPTSPRLLTVYFCRAREGEALSLHLRSVNPHQKKLPRLFKLAPGGSALICLRSHGCERVGGGGVSRRLQRAQARTAARSDAFLTSFSRSGHALCCPRQRVLTLKLVNFSQGGPLPYLHHVHILGKERGGFGNLGGDPKLSPAPGD